MAGGSLCPQPTPRMVKKMNPIDRAKDLVITDIPNLDPPCKMVNKKPVCVSHKDHTKEKRNFSSCLWGEEILNAQAKQSS